MYHKRCPNCLKKIPFKKRFGRKCPHCERTFRRRSEGPKRGMIGVWLEDRDTFFWFFLLTILTVLLALFAQVFGNPDLIDFIDEHTIWFFITMYYTAMLATIIGRIYVPLMLGAPRIIRRERVMIKQYRILTAVGLGIGVLLCLGIIGPRFLLRMFPGTVFLLTVPVALMWGYLALVLTESDYEDARTWSFLAEIGAGERLEHRQHGYMTMITLPITGLVFYYLSKNPFLFWWIKNSILLALFRELWHRATTKETALLIDTVRQLLG